MTGGSLIPTLTLGIPGESVTAVLMGGLIIHGLQPGPELFTTYAGMTYTFFAGFVLVQFFMLGVGMLGCKGFAQNLPPVRCHPHPVHLPAVRGRFLRHPQQRGGSGHHAHASVSSAIWRATSSFNAAAIVLGLILGPIGERGLRRSLLISDGDPSILFSTSLCWILIALCVLGVLSPLLMERVERRHARKRRKLADGCFPAVKPWWHDMLTMKAGGHLSVSAGLFCRGERLRRCG